MNKTALMERLRRKRMLLLKAYVLHVGLFASTCACAATDTAQVTIATSIWLTLITVVPVLLYTVIVHKAIRAVEPSAPSVGLKEILITTALLTPLESGLFMPARNLWIARGILRAWDKAHAFRLVRHINLLSRCGARHET